MAGFSARAAGRDGWLRQVAAWMGAVVVYGAAQGLSAWVARYAQGRGTRPQYEQFERPAFAPPGAVFPVVWTTLNLTTATSAWLVWRAGEAGGTVTAGGPGVVGAGCYRPQRLRAAGCRQPPPVGGHRRFGAAVRCHGALCLPGSPG
jgi:hypothetical protein